MTRCDNCHINCEGPITVTMSCDTVEGWRHTSYQVCVYVWQKAPISTMTTRTATWDEIGALYQQGIVAILFIQDSKHHLHPLGLPWGSILTLHNLHLFEYECKTVEVKFGDSAPKFKRSFVPVYPVREVMNVVWRDASNNVSVIDGSPPRPGAVGFDRLLNIQITHRICWMIGCTFAGKWLCHINVWFLGGSGHAVRSSPPALRYKLI